jgi:hypothetical protein
VVSGRADEAGLAGLRARWPGIVDVSRAPADAAGAAGADGSTAILVRPDGYVGFLAAPADAAGLGAVDAHLASYLAGWGHGD